MGGIPNFSLYCRCPCCNVKLSRMADGEGGGVESFTIRGDELLTQCYKLVCVERMYVIYQK